MEPEVYSHVLILPKLTYSEGQTRDIRLELGRAEMWKVVNKEYLNTCLLTIAELQDRLIHQQTLQENNWFIFVAPSTPPVQAGNTYETRGGVDLLVTKVEPHADYLTVTFEMPNETVYTFDYGYDGSYFYDNNTDVHPLDIILE